MKKHAVYVIPDFEEFPNDQEQKIAVFSDMDEDFMDEICEAISDLRDVKCRWVEVEE